MKIVATLTTEDGNKADTVRIADTGAHSVTVREMIGGGARNWVGGERAMFGAMRALAVRALKEEHDSRLYRFERTRSDYDGVQMFATYAAVPRYTHRGMAGYGYCVDCGTTGAREVCTGPGSR